MFRNLLAITVLLLACAGFVLFVAVGWWVWPLKTEVNRQAEFLAGKANAAAKAADHTIDFVRDVTARAEGELALARTQATDRPRAPANPFLQMTAIRASHDLIGSVERAQGAVIAASDAVKVADAALNVASDTPELNSIFGVSPEQLNMTRSSLLSVADELRSARGVLSISPEASQLTAEQLDAVEGALGRVKAFADQIANVVDTARNRVNDTRASVEVWSRWLAIAVTLISVLGVVGQFFLARFCWRKLRDLPA
jgi:hydrogenase maturation protease